ncbi:MAG: exodeoxyribonuclease VII small subunit [Candidatus Zixiibacteriota bacterium]
MTDKKPSFESAFERLSEIVEQLESGDAGLEESLKLYAEGMKLAKLCGEKLSEAEKTIEKLTAEARADAPSPDSPPSEDGLPF